MKIKSLDGIVFEKMLRNALNNIKINEKKVNSMNVFPVPDGDTGSNMRMTLENGVTNTKTNSNLGEYLKDLSRNMLIGARGNSGVILSQLFRGFFEELRRCSIANSQELKDAFINAYKMAYKAVPKPTEGTILTVAREGIEHIKNQISRSTRIDTFFAIYLAEMKKSLDYTPELLPMLKEAGVKLAIASSKPLVFLEIGVRETGAGKHIEEVVGPELKNHEANKAYLVRAACERLGIEPSKRVAMIGDRFYDIDGANEVGVTSIGVEYGFGHRKEFEDHNADYIATTVDDLRKIFRKTRKEFERNYDTTEVTSIDACWNRK